VGETKQTTAGQIHSAQHRAERKRKEKKKQQDETKAETTHAHENTLLVTLTGLDLIIIT
jgi:hypothetical protein